MELALVRVSFSGFGAFIAWSSLASSIAWSLESHTHKGRELEVCVRDWGGGGQGLARGERG